MQLTEKKQEQKENGEDNRDIKDRLQIIA